MSEMFEIIRQWKAKLVEMQSLYENNTENEEATPVIMDNILLGHRGSTFFSGIDILPEIASKYVSVQPIHLSAEMRQRINSILPVDKTIRHPPRQLKKEGTPIVIMVI